MRDEEAIRNLLAEYSMALCDSRWDDWAELFTEDGEMHTRGNVVKGRDALRVFIEKGHAGKDRPKPFTANISIQVRDDQADVRSDVYVMRAGAKFSLECMGRYTDVLRKRPDGWRIECRRIELLFPSADAS